MVLTRSLEPGPTVAASFTAPERFVIAENLERMKLKVAVAEADIGGVQEGQVATFTVDTDGVVLHGLTASSTATAYIMRVTR